MKKWLFYCFAGVSFLILCAMLLTIWLPPHVAYRTVFGAIYLLLLPGYFWSHVFWKTADIEVLERLVLSLALSIVLVPLFVLSLNKLGVKINALNILIETFALIAISIVIINSKKIKLHIPL